MCCTMFKTKKLLNRIKLLNKIFVVVYRVTVLDVVEYKIKVLKMVFLFLNIAREIMSTTFKKLRFNVVN